MLLVDPWGKHRRLSVDSWTRAAVLVVQRASFHSGLRQSSHHVGALMSSCIESAEETFAVIMVKRAVVVNSVHEHVALAGLDTHDPALRS